MISAGVGLWLASVFVPGVEVFTGQDSQFFGLPLRAPWQFFIVFGIILGLLNFFVKPILDTITLPLRIITLGLFGFFINMALIFLADYIFSQMHVSLFYPLVWTTVIIWGMAAIISKFIVSNKD